MKKIIISLIFVFILASSVSAITINQSTTYATPKSADLEIISLKYEPYPVTPGEYFKLWVKVENLGTDPASELTIKLEENYPFSLHPDESATRNFGKIDGNEELVLEYKIKVDEDAVEGTNELELKYQTSSGVAWVTKKLEILIQTIDATISVVSVESEPEQIAPGETGKIKIKIKNIADSVIKDISVKLDLSSSTLPLAPIGSTTEKKIRMLDSGEDATISFNAMAEADAASQVYKVPLRIRYFDELGTEYSKNHTVGLIIGSEPDVMINLEESEILSVGDIGTVIISIVNKGLTDMKLLNVELEESEDYEILSSRKIYVGNLESDEYESIEFRVYLKNSNGKGVIMPLSLEYRDANNKLYHESAGAVLRVYDKDEISKFGLRGDGSSSSLLIGVVLIVLVYFGYKRYKNRSR